MRHLCGLAFLELPIPLVLLACYATAATDLDGFQVALGDFVVGSVSTTSPHSAPFVDGEGFLIELVIKVAFHG
tara:strand:- start:1904 stop:2122 length:219 start_codon:yes stop_codon:yes gene_type:complete